MHHLLPGPQTLRRDAPARAVLAQLRDEVRTLFHPLALHAQDVDDVGIRYRVDLERRLRKLGRQQRRLHEAALEALFASGGSDPADPAMIARHARAAGIETLIGNHSFRATGITAYLKNGGTLEKAAQMANHASTRTTQLYDRRREELSLDEVERIRV